MQRLASVSLLLLLAAYTLAQEQKAITLYGEEHGVFDKDLLSPEFHRSRREALRTMLPEKSAAVLFANPVRNRSNDVDYEYHQDPNFYYLSGSREPNSMLFIFKDSVLVNGHRTDELLVLQDRDARTEIWEGRKLGAEGAMQTLGFRSVLSGDAFREIQMDLNSIRTVAQRQILENLADDPHRKDDLMDLMEVWGELMITAGLHENDPELLQDAMASLREVKTEEEIALLRKAINITCQAQIELMRQLQPGMHEYETEAIVEYIFKKNGAEHEGFPSIQGGGAHSCVLHYITNRRKLEDGDLLVSDIGAEYHGYTADVTRTLPANGKFTLEQTAIYELVLEAQNAGIGQAQVGNEFWAPHKAATDVITAGLLRLGVIKNPADVRKYFMHGTSHYLGLDVHDAGTYGPLKANSVITVEPGIYIAKGSPCDPKWWDIGVRIEDDILITINGPENLSAAAPRLIDDIEGMTMNGR